MNFTAGGIPQNLKQQYITDSCNTMCTKQKKIRMRFPGPWQLESKTYNLCISENNNSSHNHCHKETLFWEAYPKQFEIVKIWCIKSDKFNDYRERKTWLYMQGQKSWNQTLMMWSIHIIWGAINLQWRTDQIRESRNFPSQKIMHLPRIMHERSHLQEKLYSTFSRRTPWPTSLTKVCKKLCVLLSSEHMIHTR